MKYDAPPDDGGVLPNKLGITDLAELEKVESAVYQVREQDCLQRVGEFKPTLSYFQDIHRHLFQDVYPWAGELRQVDIAKGTTRFANWQYLGKESEKLFAKMEAEALHKRPPEQFYSRAAEYFGELNVLHPFREGNGRSQRVLFQALAQSAGTELRWQRVQRQEIVQNCIAAYQGDYKPLEATLQKCAVVEKAQEQEKGQQKERGVERDFE